MNNKDNKIPLDGKSMPNFVIDDSALKDIFEGNDKGSSNKLLMKLKEMDDSGMKITAITTLSAFLRAIYLSDPKVKINKIQKTLSFLQVVPSFADFKIEKEVREEIIKFAHIMSGSRNESKKDFDAAAKIGNKLNKVWIGEGRKANICVCSIKPFRDMNKKIICTECKENCYIAKEENEETKSMKADNIKNICTRCALLNHKDCLNETQIKILEHELS